MIKIKNKHTKKISFFRFFDLNTKEYFWHTKTTESCGFNLGRINDYEPLKTTWEKIKNG